MAKSDNSDLTSEPAAPEAPVAPPAAAPDLPVLNEQKDRLTGDLGGMQPGLAPGEYTLPNGLKVITN